MKLGITNSTLWCTPSLTLYQSHNECGIPQPIPLKVHFIFRPHGEERIHVLHEMCVSVHVALGASDSAWGEPPQHLRKLPWLPRATRFKTPKARSRPRAGLL